MNAKNISLVLSGGGARGLAHIGVIEELEKRGYVIKSICGTSMGAMIGGILLGIIEILGKAYISSQMADAIVFAVLIIVLLVKPTGIFGKNIQEKVCNI